MIIKKLDKIYQKISYLPNFWAKIGQFPVAYAGISKGGQRRESFEKQTWVSGSENSSRRKLLKKICNLRSKIKI